MIRRLNNAIAAAALLAALSGCNSPQQANDATTQPGDAMFAAGEFSLIGADGRTVSRKTLKGKPYAIFFGFTRCPDVCPTTLSRMAHLRKELGKDGDRFSIVFVSVDPEHDKPADIGNYVALFGTPIIGATGDPQHLAQAVKNFGVFYRKVPQPGGDYSIDHTASVYLMDSDGRFVTTIDHAESNDMALAKLKRLVN